MDPNGACRRRKIHPKSACSTEDPHPDIYRPGGPGLREGENGRELSIETGCAFNPMETPTTIGWPSSSAEPRVLPTTISRTEMFGVVEVDSVHNGRLREKAGREGFRENKAYRDLRGILKNFLVQVAADFFREEGVHGERFAARKRELDDIERHRRARAKKATAKRNKFKRDLTTFFDRMEKRNRTRLSWRWAWRYRGSCAGGRPR